MDGFFPSPRPSFTSAVVPPGVDPTSTPSVTVTFACAWLPFVRGALQQLVLAATWDVDTDAALVLAQLRAMTLLSLFVECSGELIPVACPYDWQAEEAQLGWFGDSSGVCAGAGAWTGAGWESVYAGAPPACDGDNNLSIAKGGFSGQRITSVEFTYTSTQRLEVGLIDGYTGSSQTQWEVDTLPAGTAITTLVSTDHTFSNDHLRFFMDNSPGGGGNTAFTLHKVVLGLENATGACP